MMYIFPLSFFLGALYSGQSFCIYMGCTDIGYCIYDICGFYEWFWFSFMVMCFWLCVWMYVYGCMFGYVFGYVYGHRVSILREAWFNEYRGLPLLGARFHYH
jgi:hypothetical protein